MRRLMRFRPLAQLLDDALLGNPGRTGGAPHLKAPSGAQGLHLQFVVASLPVAALIAGHSLPGHALLFAVALLTAVAWELVFAAQRRRPVDEGVLLTAWLFALIAPPGTPVLQVVASVSFGVVFGKAVFGGSGRYLVSPPLLALVFLAFAWPDTVPDPVGFAPAPGRDPAVVLACLAGAAWLVVTGSASWRVMLGAVLGLLLTTMLAPGTAWYAPMLSGGFAFGVAFLATDPTASALTNPGRLAYGLLAGLLSAVVGILFAILLASLAAPLFDAAVVAANVHRRRARERSS